MGGRSRKEVPVSPNTAAIPTAGTKLAPPAAAPDTVTLERNRRSSFSTISAPVIWGFLSWIRRTCASATALAGRHSWSKIASGVTPRVNCMTESAECCNTGTGLAFFTPLVIVRMAMETRPAS